MKVLYVTLGLPYPPVVGAQIRDFELVRRISEWAAVRVVALAESAPEAGAMEEMARVVEQVDAIVVPTALSARLLRRLPSHLWAGRPPATLPFVRPSAVAALRTIMSKWKPDIFQVEHSFLAPYLAAVPPGDPCRTVLSMHNVGEVQYERIRESADGIVARAVAGLKSRAMRGWEVDRARRYDSTVVVSEADRDHLLARDASLHLCVVPNGVDTGLRRPLPPATGHGLLFVGNLAYSPNAEAVHFFCDEVLPSVQMHVPDATFTIVGAGAPARVQALDDRPGVTVAGLVPDVEPYYGASAACVVPLRAGSGTRLKILEAMALGRPVVSTTVGCEGLAVSHGEHLLVADDPVALAREVVRLLQDPFEGQRLARRARARVEEQYDWGASADRLHALYTELVLRGADA
ncbi:glycosyltransferase family 4 protein [Rubrivirga sp. IMCC43871]|uniref:glycosyltransferase family 4 protein n=1 Tax=Rubrivirga sp. IMCC43871 TaxID=3391575 RepID=UPI00398FADB2